MNAVIKKAQPSNPSYARVKIRRDASSGLFVIDDIVMGGKVRIKGGPITGGVKNTILGPPTSPSKRRRKELDALVEHMKLGA